MIAKALTVFLAASCVFAVVRAEGEESAVDLFKDDVAKAAEKVKEVGDHIVKMLGLENNPVSDDVVQIIKTQAKNFADQAEQVQKQLEQELKQFTSSPVAETFTELSKKIGETVVSFRDQIEASNVTQRATELQGKFQEGINTLIEESKKIAKDLEPQVTDAGKELEKLTKKVLDDAVENLTQIQDRIHKATGHNNN